MLPTDVDIDDGPLEYRPKTVSFPLVSEELVASIALGMEDELVVAARHGMSVEGYQELAAQPWFQAQVAAKRSEYEKTGVTFKAKAGWMASELLDQVYLQAASMDSTLNQKHEVLKTLIKAAGLEPKEEKAQASGPTFQISIDLGSGNTLSLTSPNAPSTIQPPPTIDVEAKEVGQ